MKKTTRIGLGLATVSAAVLAATAAYGALHLVRSARLAAASVPFEHEGPPDAPRILVIGDSTAEGTGASRPELSLAGRLSEALAPVTLVNRGRDGARFDEFLSQIPPEGRFDAVLVVGGGNDVFRLTGEDALRAAVRGVARAASERARLVVFVPPGNVGNAPFFLPPWRGWMRHRSLMLHAIVSEEARAVEASYVDLFQERENDPFAQDPDRMNAADGLHPSDDGYALWLAEVQRQARLGERLAAMR